MGDNDDEKTKGGILVRWGFGIILGCSHYPSTRGGNWKTERTRDAAGMSEEYLSSSFFCSRRCLKGVRGVKRVTSLSHAILWERSVKQVHCESASEVPPSAFCYLTFISFCSCGGEGGKNNCQESLDCCVSVCDFRRSYGIFESQLLLFCCNC